jgi:hypothetical protein
MEMTASALRRDIYRILDRVIVAGAALITKDRTIHDHTTIALW